MANVVLVVSGFESLAHLRHTWRGWPVGNRQTVSPTVAVSFIPLLGELSASIDAIASVGSVLTVALSSTETLPMSLSLSTYVTARSGLPSPFRSPPPLPDRDCLLFREKPPPDINRVDGVDNVSQSDELSHLLIQVRVG